MNFEREFKVYKSCKCFHKLYAVEYINTVCSLDYPFNFEFFKLLNKLYKMNQVNKNKIVKELSFGHKLKSSFAARRCKPLIF